MNDKCRCQSCGMPLEGEGISEAQTNAFLGTNADGSLQQDYCKFCFQKGAFTQPDLTVGQMVENSVGFMVSELKFSPEQAKEMSEGVIPQLKRWKTAA